MLRIIGTNVNLLARLQMFVKNITMLFQFFIYKDNEKFGNYI